MFCYYLITKLRVCRETLGQDFSETKEGRKNYAADK
jgi:hypothetical protein